MTELEKVITQIMQHSKFAWVDTSIHDIIRDKQFVTCDEDLEYEIPLLKLYEIEFKIEKNVEKFQNFPHKVILLI